MSAFLSEADKAILLAARRALSPIQISEIDWVTFLDRFMRRDLAQAWRNELSLGHIVHPVVPVTPDGDALQLESATSRNLRVGIFQAATGPAEVIGSVSAGEAQGNRVCLTVVDFPYAFNGSTWDRQKTGSTKGVPASGASPITVFGAAGASLKTRVFDIVLGSSTSGVVALSDGLGSIHVLANSATGIHYGPNGVLQDTANTAITATLAGATLSAIGVGNAGE